MASRRNNRIIQARCSVCPVKDLCVDCGAEVLALAPHHAVPSSALRSLWTRRAAQAGAKGARIPMPADSALYPNRTGLGDLFQ
jgi:hypothetical protein